MPLDLDSLRHSVASLERSLRVAEDMPTMPLELRETVRAGVRDPELRSRLRVQLEIHPALAARKQLAHRRRLPTHTYDESHADGSLNATRAFLPHAKDLLHRLEERND